MSGGWRIWLSMLPSALLDRYGYQNNCLQPRPFLRMLQTVWLDMLVWRVLCCLSSSDNMLVGASSNEQRVTGMVVSISHAARTFRRMWLSTTISWNLHNSWFDFVVRTLVMRCKEHLVMSSRGRIWCLPSLHKMFKDGKHFIAPTAMPKDKLLSDYQLIICLTI